MSRVGAGSLYYTLANSGSASGVYVRVDPRTPAGAGDVYIAMPGSNSGTLHAGSGNHLRFSGFSGTVQSGAIQSGAIQSGMGSASILSYSPPLVYCRCCGDGVLSGGRRLSGVPYTASAPFLQGIDNTGQMGSGWYVDNTYCHRCVPLTAEKRAYTREDWVREGVPLAADAPAGVVADWLYDNGRDADADWMMGLHRRREANRKG
jgi:hypothetical protein